MLKEFSLQDRFQHEEGMLAMSGVQALLRLPLDQHRADKRIGLNTATLISGYRGSPLGTLDTVFQQHKAVMEQHNVVFIPAVNEELGATAVWGSQLSHLYPAPRYDGVLGMWYGKGPGVDRAGDALKHANFCGVGPYGGVLALAGDDPSAKSSTIPSHSEFALHELQMPILYPGNLQEILELGRYGFELSRYSGAWVGFKIVTNVADSYSTVNVYPIHEIVTPDFHYNGKLWRHSQTAKLVAPASVLAEKEMGEGRLEAATLFGEANHLNRVTVSSPDDWIGLVAAGKTYHDVREALSSLGFDEAGLRQAGIRLLKIGMIYPLAAQTIRQFSRGLQEIFVIEEKRGFVEGQVRNILFNQRERPIVVGKRDEEDRFLVRADAELDADQIAAMLVKRLRQKLPLLALMGQAAATQGALPIIPLTSATPTPLRTPYFCSGCPHNRSMPAPAGSPIGAGIGCHGMVLMMNPEVTGITQMGGEGAQWVGASHFSETGHFFQNLGDGTLFHSGSLAIRQAVAAKTNITYKILYNDVVAMTGGQVADGEMDVPELTRALQAEGVAKIIVCTHDLEKYPAGATWASGVEIWDRDRMDEAQRLLQTVPGATILIYDQPCAADLRRKRSRGLVPTPSKQVFINQAVCEGCGDCGAKSNCLSVVPIATEFGRKTQIHNSSCNRDYTCLAGDCPAFVTVEGSSEKPAAKLHLPKLAIDPANLAPPQQPLPAAGNLYMMGIGGTGVVTVNQILATAALLDGKQAAGLDQTGMSQKGGAVISHLKITPDLPPGSNAVGNGKADAYLVFDLLSGAAEKNLLKADPTRTVAVVSTTQTATGAMVSSTAVSFPAIDRLRQQIDAHTNAGQNQYLDATALAEEYFGTHLPANMILVGAAWQVGSIPLSASAIESAIQLNGSAIEMNQQAFRLGRQLVIDPHWRPAAASEPAQTAPPQPQLDPVAQALVDAVGAEGELLRLLQIRVPELIAYQNVTYARRYSEFVGKVKTAEAKAIGTDETGLSEAVARYLFKLMAYKDEYEVARLYLHPDFSQSLTKQFGENATVTYQLHPPILKALGLKKKIGLGRWFEPGLRLLSKLKGLRGTPLDIFGYAEMRRVERALIDEYRGLIDGVLSDLSPQTLERAIKLAELPDLIRGYEEVKLGNIGRFRAALAALAVS